MPEIHLPSKIIFERNSIQKFFPDVCERALIISDSHTLAEKGIIEVLSCQCRKKVTHVCTVSNTQVYELYNSAAEKFFEEEPELIIAIGSAAAIDCGMLLTHESGAEFTAIPCCGASALTDFENAGYYTYRHSPDTLILDPALTETVPSATVAYDALSAFSFAIDSLASSSDIITHSLAIHGAVGILKNIVSACRGRTESLEKLMYSMCFAVAAHRNSATNSSELGNVSRFFADFGYPKSSVCAVIIPEIMQNNEQTLRNTLSDIAKAADIAYKDDEPYYASEKLIEKVRKIQASIAIPRSISGFGLTEKAFNAHKICSPLPDDLLDTCFYGSFKFMKM